MLIDTLSGEYRIKSNHCLMKRENLFVALVGTAFVVVGFSEAVKPHLDFTDRIIILMAIVSGGLLAAFGVVRYCIAAKD